MLKKVLHVIPSHCNKIIMNLYDKGKSFLKLLFVNQRNFVLVARKSSQTAYIETKITE